MKKVMHHIARLAAMLLTALSFAGCARTQAEPNTTELSISIFIPNMGATKAETGYVGALDEEKVLSSLQLWVFIHGGAKDGTLVGYKAFNANQLKDTGLPHSTITRFGMRLDWPMYDLLTLPDALVDVYAVANAESATNDALGEGTTRSQLDDVIMSGTTFGVNPLTMAVPSTGLPMSGVLKGATVTGSYPVLNVSTVILTRAVSKIRFVFCQQSTPATDTEPEKPSNTNCVIKSITFGGTSTGHDCQIAAVEKLFTDQKLPGSTDDLFDIDGYTPLEATLAGKSNGDITLMEHPDELLFQSPGHEAESAQEYENRLDEAIEASSQIGPIYIRETDKLISGTIAYNIGGNHDETVTFSMPEGDALTRNHSWILYAYFSETTKTLEFKIVVLPWDQTTYNMDFTTSPDIVNVIRRFTIPETDPLTFAKVQNINGYFDIHFWPVLNDEANSIKGDILIDSPVGQTICIIPVAGAEDGYDPVDDIYSIVSITPREHVIYKDSEHFEDGRSEDCVVEYTISCNTEGLTPEARDALVSQLEGNYIDLHFCVRIGEGDDARWIDLDSESIDYYRIYFHENWESYLIKEEEEEEG